MHIATLSSGPWKEKKGTSVKGPYLEILPHETLARGTAVREEDPHYHGRVKVVDRASL